MTACDSKPVPVSADSRLRKHADYQRVYKTGRKQFAKQIAYFVAWPPAEMLTVVPRIGLTVPKALGKAVDRNRIKRRLRAAVRQSLPLLEAPLDVVLHPRRSVIDAEFTAIVREVEIIFRAVQAIADRGPEAFQRLPQPAHRGGARPKRKPGARTKPAGA